MIFFFFFFFLLTRFFFFFFAVVTAALARRLYVSGGKGVQRLAEDLGTGSRNGRIPNRHHAAATGNVRHALQALEAMGIVEAHKKGGRKISATGRRDLDRIATRLAGLSHVKKKPVPKAKKATA
jgi:small subunit ribosomal protein S19e